MKKCLMLTALFALLVAFVGCGGDMEPPVDDQIQQIEEPAPAPEVEPTPEDDFGIEEEGDDDLGEEEEFEF
ncbi:hypothetical protein [Chitinivibrio alkaliphilus]|uniref:Secreted protein n=1 Tax=Chitinivibrio alkaliphilus ACht1 TaxID=1313304 RepID=U7D7I3_9BACT|nr:hypothetical protein [Chitinivibrio alkaliphilus]ERP38915.1 hypothetical protein CALK_0403 [Chitinivibrio alkaliphilus ACht1]